MSIGSDQLSPHSTARFSVLATVFLEQPQLAAISVLFNPILSSRSISLFAAKTSVPKPEGREAIRRGSGDA
jgi:hypothetical protein